MTNLRTFLLILIFVSLVEDGFSTKFKDSRKNSTFHGNSTKNKNTSNNNRIKFTALYLFTIVWITLTVTGFIFYYFLYYLYIPNLKSTNLKFLPHYKRKNKLFYNQINRRYHKLKSRPETSYVISEIYSKKTFETFKKSPQSLNNDYCQKCFNKNQSNTRNDCDEEEKPTGGCCCGKSKKSDCQEMERENVQLYRSRPRDCTGPNTNPRPYQQNFSPKPYELRSQPMQQRSLKNEPSKHSTKIESVTHTEVENQSPLKIQPQQEPMLHNTQQSALQNPHPATPPIQFTPLAPYPPQATQQITQKSYTQKTMVTSVPVQSYGGSSNMTTNDERTVQKGGCCAPKKKPSGSIHPKIQGYKVEGHVRLKGKKDKRTISIPEDTYMLTR